VAETGGDKVPPKTTEQLAAEVAAARARLSTRIEGLVGNLHPKSVANRAINDTRDLIDAEIGSVKTKVGQTVSGVKDAFASMKGSAGVKGAPGEGIVGFFKDEHGWRQDRFLLLGGLIAGVVTIALPVVAISVAVGNAFRKHKAGK
jgi:hypothetical protein